MQTDIFRRHAQRRAPAGGSALHLDPSNQRFALPLRAALAALLALGLAVGLPAAVKAQSGDVEISDEPLDSDPNTRLGETFQDWQMVCQRVAEDQEVCGAVQEVDNGGKLALWSAFGYFQQSEKPVLILRIPYDLTDPPTGLRVAQGIQLSIDGGAKVPVPFEICAPGGCQIGVLMEDDFVAAMKRGNRLAVGILLSSGQTATINISLRGFTAAFDALTRPE